MSDSTGDLPTGPPRPASAASPAPGASPTAAPAVPPAPGRRRRTELWLGGGVVGLLIVALAAGLAVTSVRLHDADHDNARVHEADVVAAARTTSLAAARTYAVDLASYNYRTLDQSFDQVKEHSTPAFGAKFAKSSADLSTILVKYKAVAQAKVQAAGLSTCTATQAVAIVLLTQTVTNTADKKGPTTTDSRVSLTLVSPHGQWMISQVSIL